ncbi:MAG: YdbH domain-containing protein [Sphingomonadales bacterium]|nr:YdbH domain-containing protein [Sphingomonadales bacterium]MDE2169473.1 YdbH domain-containing protein [Sphingomonadales bacterium]
MVDPRGNIQTDEMAPLMGEEPDAMPEAPPRARRRRRMALWGLGGLGVAVVGMLGSAWIWRVDLVRALIEKQLEQAHLPARYRIEDVGAGRLVLADVVLGDPRHPDATARRVVVEIGASGTSFSLASLMLDGVRLHGRWQDGHLSLGRLDPLLTSSSGPSALPNVELDLRDAELGIDSAAGAVSLAASGSGHLRDGFAGKVLLRAPSLHGQGCEGSASLDGRLTTSKGRPHLSGPLDLSALHCRQTGLTVPAARLAVDALGDKGLDGGELLLDLAPAGVSAESLKVQALSGQGRLTVRAGRLAAGWTLAGKGVNLPGLAARSIGVEGRISGEMGLTHVAAEGSFSGEGVAPDNETMATMARWQASAQGTMVAPLIARLEDGLRREGLASRLTGTWSVRRGAHGFSLVIPTARWSGPRAHLEGSRLMVAGGGITGNLSLVGDDLPRMNIRVAPVRGGQSADITVAPWQADGAAITVPALRVARRDGRVEMAGQVLVSGAVPGGVVQDLDLPLVGDWSARGGLVLGRACAPVRFGGISAGSLVLKTGEVALCPAAALPGGGHAVLAVNGKAIHWGVTSQALALDGTLSGEALHLTSGPLLLGERQADLRDLSLALGSGGAVTRAHLDHVTADLTGPINGMIEGGVLSLAALPINISAVNSPWRWADGALLLDGGSLTLADRTAPALKGGVAPDAIYEPLSGRDIHARLENGVFSAQGQVRSAGSDRGLGTVSLTQDLGSGNGRLDADVAALTFDKGLQPEDLSKLTRGMIADAAGTLSGDAHIAWKGGKVTSTGHLSSPGFDFASAAGPVRGVKGTVTFTDLLGLVTDGEQHVTVGSINPGIEADNGLVDFALQPGHVLHVAKAEWPFLDGRMWLEPFTLHLGVSEERRFNLDVQGISAARFLERMNMGNLSASGMFDGRLPLVFDDKGGHVVGGSLLSRAPGGTVAYVGALTYKNLSPMANYAFKALRDMRYQEMRIDMNGDLAGELVSRVELRGISQGRAASRNIVTRQIARLPIQFNVNVRAPFYSLIGSVRSLYDATAVADPRSVGLVGADGKPVKPAQAPAAPAASSSATGIQPSVSEPRP